MYTKYMKIYLNKRYFTRARQLPQILFCLVVQQRSLKQHNVASYFSWAISEAPKSSLKFALNKYKTRSSKWIRRVVLGSNLVGCELDPRRCSCKTAGEANVWGVLTSLSWYSAWMLQLPWLPSPGATAIIIPVGESKDLPFPEDKKKEKGSALVVGTS